MLRLGILLVVSLGASSARADCAFYGLLAKPLTPAGTAIPDDGGILIGAIADQKGTLDTGDAALQSRFQWKGIKQAMVALAPGLAVLRLPPGGKATELVDRDGKPALQITRAKDKRPPLEAPKVTRVSYENRPTRRSIEKVLVAFDEVPATAVAIVISDAKGTPRSWALIEATKPTTGAPAKPIVHPGYSSHSCKALPNNTVPSKTGDTVIVQFVDDVGRLSPATKPIKVTAVP